MRFLHLSDLHLGKRVNEFSMLEDQAYILKEILNIIDEQKVEAVLIAGDIYDKVIPSAEAVRLLDDFLTRIAARELPVFLISGNHDSAERIAFGSRLMSSRQIYLSPVFESDVEPVTISDRYGEINIYMLPFVKPSLVKKSVSGGRDHHLSGCCKCGSAAYADRHRQTKYPACASVRDRCNKM